MADASEDSILEEIFLRERIHIEDIRSIVSNGFDQLRSDALTSFSSIRQRSKRTRANWKALNINFGPRDEWGQEARLALTDMMDSGLCANLEELVLEGQSRFDNEVIIAVAACLQSGTSSSLRHLKLEVNIYSMEVAEALAEYLRSEHANLLESLLISGGFDVLEEIFRSLGCGRASMLQELCLKDFHTTQIIGEAPLTKSLVKALEEGGMKNLRALKLQGRGFGWNALSTLAQCPHLEMLEFLDLSETDVFEDDSGILASALQSNQLQDLRTLKVRALNRRHDRKVVDTLTVVCKSLQSGSFTKLCSLNMSKNQLAASAIEYIILWLESGKASNMTEIDYLTSTEYARLPRNVRNQNLLRIAKALEMRKLQSLQEFPLLGNSKVSREVERAFLNAYQHNKFLIATLLRDNVSETKFVKTLRRHEQLNKQYVEMMKALGNEPNVPATYGKLFICGSPRIGKTTLRRTLTKERSFWKLFSKPKDESPTRGIEVDHLLIAAKDPNEPERELALWDLAGQYEYEVLHSAFLPDLALADGQATFFLIVCSANADKDSSLQTARETLLYWLKFIASNSPVLDLRRRRVSVVLNCFHNERSGHELDEWKGILVDCQTRFKDFLKLHPKPFIINVQAGGQVRSLKKHIRREALDSLLQIRVPKICADILGTCRTWAANNQDYPVLSWEEYHAFFKQTAWSFEKFKAATTYLHEAGHLILFKKLGKSKQSQLEDQPVPGAKLGKSKQSQPEDQLVHGAKLEKSKQAQPEDQLVHGAVVVLNPEWLCNRVIGDLLLPEFLLNRGETSLASSYMRENGSLRLALVARDRFEIPDEKCEEMVRILERLGLGYTLPDDHQDIFIPALIQDDDPPEWFIGGSQNWTCEEISSWVMGFSLASKDFHTTLLPVAILRNLQVRLALDKDKGRQPDSEFKAGISRISFKWRQVGILVEYYHNPDNSQQNRLDILVKPLATNMSTSRSNAKLRRQKQVKLAKEIVHQTLSIASNCCPGLELETSIIKPWQCREPFVVFRERNVDFSVEQMVIRMHEEIDSAIKHEKDLEEVALTTNWDIGGELVEYQDVLGEEDLQNVTSVLKDVSLRTKFALTSLGLVPEEEFRGIKEDFHVQPDANTAETQDSDFGLAEAGSTDEVQKLRHDIKLGFTSLQQRFDQVQSGIDQVRSDIRGMTEKLGEGIKLQISLNRYVHSLVTFTAEDKETIVPRFLYLTKSREEKSPWVRLKDVFSQEVFVHFLCEARHDDLKMHEVEGQSGVPTRYTREWAKNVAPVLDWTFKIAIVAAKIACNVVLPGLDLIPSCVNRSLGDVGQIIGGVQDLLSDVSEWCSESIRNNLEFSPEYTTEAREARRATLRYVKREVVGKLSDEEFEQQIGLWRVRILDSRGHNRRVGWICRACRRKYGRLAIDMPVDIN